MGGAVRNMARAWPVNGPNHDARRWTDTEKSRDGIDAHDNFVAKPHDLNEIVADERLRQVLAEAGFPSLLGSISQERWAQELKSSGRVLDFRHYYDQASPENKRKVANAFVQYEQHFMRSNMQFAIDSHANLPDVSRHGLPAVGVTV